MKSLTFCRFVGNAACLVWIAAISESRIDAAQQGGLPALAERVAALEALVTAQSNQIAMLTGALEAEMHARIEVQLAVLAMATNHADQRVAAEATVRQAADTALQAQISNIQPSPFSATEVSTLHGLAGILTIAQSNIHVAGNISVAGDFAIRDGRTLFVNRIQPIGQTGLGNPAGLTVFAGNVGIGNVGLSITNSLFVDTIQAFQGANYCCCTLTIGDGRVNNSCVGNGIPTIFTSPVLFRR